MKFETKDSGEREEYESGMVRDATGNKPRFDLIPVLPMRRLAELYARGAEKYGDRNWQLANSEEELQRFKASCMRHIYQWLDGESDEDHAIAAVFNIFAYLVIEEKLGSQTETPAEPKTSANTTHLDDLLAEVDAKKNAKEKLRG